MPAPGERSVRPRRDRPPATPKPNGAHHDELGIDPRRLALTHALEELHIAAKELRLPPMRLEWEEPDPEQLEVDPEAAALQRHMQAFLADYEGLRAGPIAVPLASIPAPADPDAFLVGNLVRPGTLCMIAGPPGAAKSWASRQLALCAAAGVRWFLDRYEIARPLNVLVIDEDNGPDEEWRRDESLTKLLGLSRDVLTNIRRVSLAGVQLDAEPWQRWLRGQIRMHEIDVTILDPISEMHGGKELREDPAFRSLLGFLKRLKVDFPHHATVAVHHTRKRDQRASGPSSLEDVRGQWGQTPDVVAMMSPIGDRRTKWETHKRVPHSSLILEQLPEGDEGQGGLRMVADESVQRAKAMENDDTVLTAIRDGLVTHGDIQQATGMKSSTLTGVLRRLMKNGLIRQDGRGRGARYEEVEDVERSPVSTSLEEVEDPE